jgi:small neutral amino acid transporter SnatA (MarC family)
MILLSVFFGFLCVSFAGSVFLIFLGIRWQQLRMEDKEREKGI